MKYSCANGSSLSSYKLAVFIVGGLLMGMSDAFAQYALTGWGENLSGQLGDNTNVNRPTPVVLESTPPAQGQYVYISSGGNYTMAIREDGSLWGWGTNVQAQLGNGGRSATNVLTPQLTHAGGGTHGKWIKVVAGYNHSVGIREDGTLWAWGSARAVENGYTNMDDIIVSAVQLDKVSGNRWIDIDACGDFASFGGVSNGATIAMRSDGKLFGWGVGGYYVFGNGSQGKLSYPTEIVDTTGTGWQEFSMGYYFVLAILKDGSLWGWGLNDLHQVGIADGVNKQWPTLVDIGTGGHGKWKTIAAGSYHSLGIREDGSLWGWGMNGSGEVGDGTQVTVAAPKLIDDGTSGKWVQVVAGRYVSYGLKEDGTVWGWGSNQNGAMGNGTTGGTVLTPTQITALGTVNATKTMLARGWAQKGGLLLTEVPAAQPPCFAARMNVAHSSTTDATIVWEKFNGITGYEFAIDQSPTLTPTGTVTQTTDTFYHATSLTPGGLYYAHIRTNCGNGNFSRWDTISFRAANVCAKPTGLRVDGLALGGADVYWNPVAGAQEYDVVVDQSPTLAPAGSPATTADTFYSSMLLNGGATYYVHVRTHCGGGNYSAWDTLSFYMPGSCADPLQIRVGQVIANSAEVSWNRIGSAQAYEVAVDTFPTLMPMVTPATTVDTFYATMSLIAGRRYFAHVRSDCGGGVYGSWDTLSFRTPQATQTVADAQPWNDAIIVYPNPVRSSLHILGPASLQAEVYGMDGRLLIRKDMDSEHVLDMSGLAEGIYMLRLKDETGVIVYTERLIRAGSR